MPKRQVMRFQATAPRIPDKTRVRASAVGSPSRLTNPPIVSATAVPTISGPRNSNTATRQTARTGVMAREAMTVATMFEAS